MPAPTTWTMLGAGLMVAGAARRRADQRFRDRRSGWTGRQRRARQAMRRVSSQLPCTTVRYCPR
ncbi:hypothetical protein DPH57_08855 [Massilia sp. YMA4]|nr:hypothetical protein DPH57_08855 [Massilia sp. YMA4]